MKYLMLINIFLVYICLASCRNHELSGEEAVDYFCKCINQDTNIYKSDSAYMRRGKLCSDSLKLRSLLYNAMITGEYKGVRNEKLSPDDAKKLLEFQDGYLHNEGKYCEKYAEMMRKSKK